jgi:4-hydroxybenzoate polyprenyltransferase
MGPQLAGLVRTMRPKQWTKNGFVLVALIFDRKLADGHYLLSTLAGFALLCLVSSAIYIINDLVDIEQDRAHPVKRSRPLPSGQLSISVATVAAVTLLVVSLPLGFLLNPVFGIILAGYFLLQLGYSCYLKHQVLIDVLALAAGFLLRVAAGVALVAPVTRFSPWLYVFTGTLALFLGFTKRRQELVLLEAKANHSRPILDQYNIQLLDELILIVTASTIITYALYTFSAEGLPDNHVMMLTNPFVLYGIFRYLYLIHVKGVVATPDEVLLSDRPIQITVALWGIAVIVALYLLA